MGHENMLATLENLASTYLSQLKGLSVTNWFCDTLEWFYEELIHIQIWNLSVGKNQS